MNDKVYDIIIVGGGPAGLTSCIYSARKQLKTLLVSPDIGGQVSWTSEIENYMGYQFITGGELTKKFEEQVKQFPIEMEINDEAVSLKKSGDFFSITTKNNKSFLAKTV